MHLDKKTKMQQSYILVYIEYISLVLFKNTRADASFGTFLVFRTKEEMQIQSHIRRLTDRSTDKQSYVLLVKCK